MHALTCTTGRPQARGREGGREASVTRTNVLAHERANADRPSRYCRYRRYRRYLGYCRVHIGTHRVELRAHRRRVVCDEERLALLCDDHLQPQAIAYGANNAHRNPPPGHCGPSRMQRNALGVRRAAGMGRAGLCTEPCIEGRDGRTRILPSPEKYAPRTVPEEHCTRGCGCCASAPTAAVGGSAAAARQQRKDAVGGNCWAGSGGTGRGWGTLSTHTGAR